MEKSVALVGYGNSPSVYYSKMEQLIFNDEVIAILNEKPNWNKVEKVVRKHPPLEGELIRGLCIINQPAERELSLEKKFRHLMHRCRNFFLHKTYDP